MAGQLKDSGQLQNNSVNGAVSITINRAIILIISNNLEIDFNENFRFLIKMQIPKMYHVKTKHSLSVKTEELLHSGVFQLTVQALL